MIGLHPAMAYNRGHTGFAALRTRADAPASDGAVTLALVRGGSSASYHCTDIAEACMLRDPAAPPTSVSTSGLLVTDACAKFRARPDGKQPPECDGQFGS